MTLTAMDNYMYTAYQKRRSPKGIISVTTDNLESMKSFWKTVDEKMERDPHYIPKVGIESQTGRGGVNWIKFMDTLEEMQYIAVRDELRNRIAAFYGVSQIFMIDNGKSGGLNNEGMQIQRMVMLGYQPELMEEGDRDIRFTYKKLDPQAQEGPPGMPPAPGGAPPGQMPGGQMIVPPSQPGGEGAGIRTPQGPASPQSRTSPGIGSPVTSVQQRGPPDSQAQKNQEGISNARRIRGA